MLSGAYEILVGIDACSLYFRVIQMHKYAIFYCELINICRQVSEEDEVCSVAQLLGDLVAYRASGTGHLELLAGFY